MSGDLPPGVTQYDIDSQLFEEEEPEDEEEEIEDDELPDTD